MARKLEANTPRVLDGRYGANAKRTGHGIEMRLRTSFLSMKQMGKNINEWSALPPSRAIAKKNLSK
jgi:hypothetical protein